MYQYDPWEHAAQRGLTIRREPLSHPHHQAELYIDERLILLQPGQTWRAERSAIAHEILHDEYGDRAITEHTIEWSRRERRCDRIAAERLINSHRLTQVMINQPDPGSWCLELDVTARLMKVYLQHHPEIAIAAQRHTEIRLDREHTEVMG